MGIQSSNVTYDENIYHVTVDVKDNTEKGCLEATVTYEDSDGAPVFVNTYIRAEERNTGWWRWRRNHSWS